MTEAPINQHLISFSDEQLWEIISRPETFSPNDSSDLESRIEAYDQYVLLCSQALLHLKQRGYDVEQWMKLRHTIS